MVARVIQVHVFRLSVKPPVDSDILEDSESDESTDEGFDDTDFLDENGKPRAGN